MRMAVSSRVVTTLYDVMISVKGGWVESKALVTYRVFIFKQRFSVLAKSGTCKVCARLFRIFLTDFRRFFAHPASSSSAFEKLANSLKLSKVYLKSDDDVSTIHAASSSTSINFPDVQLQESGVRFFHRFLSLFDI
ncbi:unnamed protein product [Sphagnum jensenii]|uniref:Uncharacterized protein n=1 Tax=Sphagnum jensenii TaxID=128206 RepID=A0ABP0X6D4_9BRYO